MMNVSTDERTRATSMVVIRWNESSVLLGRSGLNFAATSEVNDLEPVYGWKVE